MKKRVSVIVCLCAFLVLGLLAVIPQKWEIRTYEDFLKGKFEGVSISAEGVLSLSPREEKIEAPSEEFYLSFFLAADGAAYLGTGHGGKIYRISKEGKVELYFQSAEMDVTCLAQDKKGILYAGTSPNGKIYKITAQGTGEVFFNPQEKYIWELLFRENENLLAAVGESGGIYEITPQAEGKMILKAEENHILCLKVDKNGELLAGSGGEGLIYRITKTGKVSVLFESPFEEVKSIALDDEGNIYAGAGGVSSKAKKEDVTAISPLTQAEVIISVAQVTAAQPTTAPAQTATPSRVVGVPVSGQKEPSALYKISPDGMSKRLWNSSEELIYSLLWNKEEKRLLFGTGNKGRVYSLDKNEKISLLLQKNSEQVYALFPAVSKIYLLANNPSQLSALFPEQRFNGEYLSYVLDSRTISSWGKVSWDAEMPQGATLQLQSRSGNSFEPNQTWSDWSPPYQKKEGEQILSPRARYLQFKVLFKAQSGRLSPALSKVNLFFLQTNLAPVIAKVELLGPNEVYLKPPEQEEIIWGMERRNPDQVKKDEKMLMLPKKVERKGFQTVDWDASDENGDTILFSIFLRKEGEKNWRLLEEKWTESVFAFNTVNFPDGVYFIKVVASDSPSNPPELEKQAEKVGAPLVIDNTPPGVKSFQAVKDKNGLNVAFQVEDVLSSIKEVKYLIRPDDWRLVFPEDGICDSKQESFKFLVKLAANSDNLITVMIKDSSGNVSVFRESI